MPRPSLKDVRTIEILDAFAACVARYGLDGATLDRISVAAGVKRPILRHYLGNRHEMIDRLIDHVLAGFNGTTGELFAALPETGRWETLMDMLFHHGDRPPLPASVFQAFVTVADRYPKIRDGLLDVVTRLESGIASEAAREYPNAEPARCRLVGAGITAIYFNTEAIGPLGPSRDWFDAQRRAAELLVKDL